MLDTQQKPALASRPRLPAKRIDAREATGLPTSATHSLSAWSGVAMLLVSVALVSVWSPCDEIAYEALLVMAGTALGVFVPDLLLHKVYRRTLLAIPRSGNWWRTLTKLAGLVGIVCSLALLYAIFPEYSRDGGFYHSYWIAARVLLPAWGVLALPYIHWVDRRLVQPHDGLWQCGRLLFGLWEGVDLQAAGQYLLGWVVKGFFLPLMFTNFCDDLNRLLHYDPGRLWTFRGFYEYVFFTLYFIDAALVSMTYLISLKATDTHIRSVEPSMLGWIVALLCYQPFWSLVARQYLDFDSGRPWGVMFANLPWLYYVWGCLILALVAIYVWATAAFGARFSNLTHRGIITSGPYRYSRHPAYIAKNLSWWLISVPFVVEVGVMDSLRRCALLLMLNGVYYLRAKTEERHLSADPVYVQYSRWIDRHGLLQFLNRVPVLRAFAGWHPQVPQRTGSAAITA